VPSSRRYRFFPISVKSLVFNLRFFSVRFFLRGIFAKGVPRGVDLPCVFSRRSFPRMMGRHVSPRLEYSGTSSTCRHYMFSLVLRNTVSFSFPCPVAFPSASPNSVPSGGAVGGPVYSHCHTLVFFKTPPLAGDRASLSLFSPSSELQARASSPPMVFHGTYPPNASISTGPLLWPYSSCACQDFRTGS